MYHNRVQFITVAAEIQAKILQNPEKIVMFMQKKDRPTKDGLLFILQVPQVRAPVVQGLNSPVAEVGLGLLPLPVAEAVV